MLHSREYVFYAFNIFRWFFVFLWKKIWIFSWCTKCINHRALTSYLSLEIRIENSKGLDFLQIVRGISFDTFVYWLQWLLTLLLRVIFIAECSYSLALLISNSDKDKNRLVTTHLPFQILKNKTQMINAAGIRFSFNKTKVISSKLHRRRKVFGYHSDFTNQLGW